MFKIYTHCIKRADKFSVTLLIKRRSHRIVLATGLTSLTSFTGETFPSSEPNARYKTRELLRIYEEVENILMRNGSATDEHIKRMIHSQVFGKGSITTTIIEMIEKTMKMKSAGNKTVYENLMVHINHYKPNTPIDEIDSTWLRKFYGSLINYKYPDRELSVNSKSRVMRTLRAVMNQAINDGLITDYAFKNFTIPSQETQPRAISVEQLRRLRDYPCEEWQKEYRDMFMLSFYLAAANAGDMLLCKKLENGRFVYHRQKTHKVLSIPVHPAAMKIIEKYRGKDYLLCPMDRYSDYHNYLQHWNAALKKIGEYKVVKDKVGKLRRIEYTPIIERLTTYTARYTFASIALEIGIDETTIGLCLGHSWAKTVTQRYLAINQKRIDDAIFKVIDYVNTK